VGFFLKPLEEGPRQSLEELARKVSDPSSTSYGDYLTQDELRKASGIKISQLRATHELIQQVFGGISGSWAAHGDLITVSTSDWASTYKLGQQLRFEDIGQLLFDLSTGVELVVTPDGPDESFGWICWPEQNGTKSNWNCVNQLVSSVGEARPGKANAARQHRSTKTKRRQRSDIWKQRRRGRAWRDLKQAAVWSTVKGNATNKTEPLQFAVIGRSRSLKLLTIPQKISWTSVELTFRQMGVQQSVLVKPADCVPESYEPFRPHDSSDFYDGNLAACSVDAVLENLQRVDMIAACINFDSAYSTPAGCVCQKTSMPDALGFWQTSTLDAFGRRCTQLGGRSPRQDPVDFVLPYDFASPAALREDFGIPAGLTFPDMPSQAVVEFSNETFSMEDLKTAFELFGLNPSLLNVSEDRPHTYKVKEPNAGEGSLDMQYINTLAPGAPTTWIGIDEFNMDGFMLAYVAHVNNQSTPASVHSHSWGEAELWFPPAFIKRLDYEFTKLALRGVTLLMSSGDNGISAGGPECSFMPNFALSEWTTMVGATMRSQSAAPYCDSKYFSGVGSCQERGPVVCSTIAGSYITSSGGFSMYRKRPVYQDAAVRSYLSWMNATEAADVPVPCIFPNGGNCTLGPMMAANRAFPDIAGSGHAFPTIINGEVFVYSGTSASAPAVAAIFTLLNAEQKRRGQPPLGALNPWLYQVHAKAPHAFADVTVGDTASNEQSQCKAGFSAAPGWDPATGLGVPLFNQLRDFLPTRKPRAATVETATAALRQAPGTAALMERSAEPGAHYSRLFMAACGGIALTIAAAAVLVDRTMRRLQKIQLSSEPLRQALMSRSGKTQS